MKNAKGVGPTTDEVEHWAIGLLIAFLNQHGEVVTNLGRPPAGPGRSPDFLVSSAGQTVAVEITQMWRARRLLAIADRISDQLRSEFVSQIERLARGMFVVSLNVGLDAKSRDVPTIARAIGDEILSRGATMADHDRHVMTMHGVDATIALVPSSTATIGLTQSSALSGGASPAIAAEAVAKVLSDKADQVRAYDHAWIVLIDNNWLPDPGDIESAFKDRADNVPPNWDRIFVLPVGNRDHPVELVGWRRPN